MPHNPANDSMDVISMEILLKEIADEVGELIKRGERSRARPTQCPPDKVLYAVEKNLRYEVLNKVRTLLDEVERTAEEARDIWRIGGNYHLRPITDDEHDRLKSDATEQTNARWKGGA